MTRASSPGYGLVKTTLLDFPGLVAAVVFTAGCNLRCPWCQNPGLVHAPWDEGLLSGDEVLAFLEKRKPVLQGVVVTGGEPLVHPGLADFLDRVRALGYRVKLDTNGTFPDRLAAVAPGRVDYLAFDLKNAPSAYASSAGVSVDPGLLAATLGVLRTRFVGASEVRLTWVPGLNDVATLDEYAAFVGPGLPVWVQAYRPGPVLDPGFAAVRAATPAEIDAVVAGLVARGVDARRRR
jgi:pyruvate formate lyase activating enzyme